ncbi:MAG: hypothetical protein IPN20_21825 [Haliscomenobacter sp.]|nr:hypothetical protein [Haliscomenobacter sp.]
MREDFLNELIQNQVGSNATWGPYHPTKGDPYPLVLQEAEKQTGTKCDVYWVENGIPATFTLSAPGYAKRIIIWHSRHLELSLYLRQLFINDDPLEIIRELAERQCLKAIAELSLPKKNIDFAIKAFLKSINGQSIFNVRDDLLLESKLGPIDESYFMAWFYGLAHEIGHAVQVTDEIRNYIYLNDDALNRALEDALRVFDYYPEHIKQEAKNRLNSSRKNDFFGKDHIRSEVMADLTAISILSHSAYRAIHKSGNQFDITTFVIETIIMANIITLIERCEKMAQYAAKPPNDQGKIDYVLMPIAYHIRVGRIYEYLKMLLATFGTNLQEIQEDRMEAAEDLMEEINEQYNPIIDAIDSGLSRAIKFTFDPQESHDKLFDQFSIDLKSKAGAYFRLLAKNFCQVADSYGNESKQLERLKSII